MRLFPWRRARDHNSPATLFLTKVQSTQSPGLVAEGWEEEQTNSYWSDRDGNLYKLEPIYTMTLSEYLAKVRDEGES